MPVPVLQPVAEAPPLLLLGFGAYVVAVAAVALGGLGAGLLRAGLPLDQRLRIGRLAGAGLAAWFLFLAMTAVSGFYLESRQPRFLLSVVPALLGVLALLRADWLRAAVQAMPLFWIPALQTLRIGGGSSLFAAWSVGLAPWGMVLPAGIGDILVGVAAGGVALALSRRARWAWPAAVAWNVIGLLDILHTVFRAATSAPGPQRLFFEEPANRIPAVFPFLYLAGFIVPLTILLHLLSFRQLASVGKRAQRLEA
jgi:hypothetical protein